MAKLKDKVQDALDESRIMVLGVQVLIGFDYRAAFESASAELGSLHRDIAAAEERWLALELEREALGER